MSALFATHILIYAQQAGVKADRARALIMDGGTAVSQHKQGKGWRDIGEAIARHFTM